MSFFNKPTKIRTPNGKLITVRQYAAIVDRVDHPCETGHFGCGGWYSGPCAAALMAEHGCDGCGVWTWECSCDDAAERRAR